MENKNYILRKLDWDSSKFNIPVFEVSFQKQSNENDFRRIIKELDQAKLVFFKNPTRFRENSKLISEFSRAILYDTNIVFDKNFNKKDKEILNYINYN